MKIIETIFIKQIYYPVNIYKNINRIHLPIRRIAASETEKSSSSSCCDVATNLTANSKLLKRPLLYMQNWRTKKKEVIRQHIGFKVWQMFGHKKIGLASRKKTLSDLLD